MLYVLISVWFLIATENPKDLIPGLGINPHDKDENLHRMDDFDNYFELIDKRKELLRSLENIPPHERTSSERAMLAFFKQIEKDNRGMFIRDGFRTDGSFPDIPCYGRICEIGKIESAFYR